MAKQRLMTHYCLNKECDYLEQSHKVRDGLRCPKCGGFTGACYADKNKLEAPPGSKVFRNF